MTATVTDLAIVTWAVPAERLQALLPAELEPQTIDPAGRTGLLSMVMMFDKTANQVYAQLNERTYVQRPGGRDPGAFFWRSLANTAQATLFRFLLGVPEFTDDVDLAVNGDSYQFVRHGNAVATLDLREAQPKGNAKLLARAVAITSNPPIGYTYDGDVLLATKVQHAPIAPKPVTAIDLDPGFMVPSLAIDHRTDTYGRSVDWAKPLITTYASSALFTVELPPRRIGGLQIPIWRKVLWAFFQSSP